MRRRRIRRATLGKDPTKHSGTLVANIGQGTAVPKGIVIAQTDVGARSSTGAVQTIRDSSTTQETLNVGDIVKYLNICIETASRNVTGDVPTPPDNGWLEYGITFQNQGVFVTPSSSLLGTNTLGDVLTKTYRGDCLWTGCIPVGSTQPVTLDLKIKLPPKAVKMKVGSTLTLWVWKRSVLTTDVRTDSDRVVLSYNYKAYS